MRVCTVCVREPQTPECHLPARLVSALEQARACLGERVNMRIYTVARQAGKGAGAAAGMPG